jgi:acetolactate synthase-1/2/3 large subunit
MADKKLTGAEAIVGTLADCGVTACFANPGTSEMHLVAALDREPRIRSVLCLFEGVATGAADGFARVTGRPAMSLLHLGPGYLNGGANLHNAKKAFAPSVNIVGDHASYHRQYDTPLSSDVHALVAPMAVWIGEPEGAQAAGAVAAKAYAAAFGPPAGPAFLIAPADAAWSEGGARSAPVAITPRKPASRAEIESAVSAIRAAKKPAILLGDSAVSAAGLKHAARLGAAGMKVMMETFPASQIRGAGIFAPARLGYFAEMAMAEIGDADLLVLAGAKAPISFFAYPGKPSVLTPEGCATLSLGARESDAAATLALLADALGAPADPPIATPAPAPIMPGPLNMFAIGACLSKHMPAGSIISDDGVTSSLAIYSATMGAQPHSWLFGTGGAIGGGTPVAIGAAVAAPDAKVICIAGDGAAMYTNQAFWTMAREKLDVLTIICANRSYRILNIEFERTGAGLPGPIGQQMLSLDNPAIDWVKLAEAQGVKASRATTSEDFETQIKEYFAGRGPALIEAVI